MTAFPKSKMTKMTMTTLTRTHRGDYNCVFSISEEELKTIVAPAQELVKVISALIGYSREDNAEP